MKNLFIIVAVAGLMACNSAETENPIVIQQCCDTISSDTVDQVDAHPTDSCGHSEIDSLQNVGELLDYLETIPSTHR